MPGQESASSPFQTTEERQLNEIGGFSTCLGYAKKAVTDAAIVALTPIPKNARYAVLVVMCDPAITDPVESSNVIYVREDGGNPVTGAAPAGDGMPLGDLSIYEVKGIKNLKNFKMIGIRVGETHSVRIQYFG